MDKTFFWKGGIRRSNHPEVLYKKGALKNFAKKLKILPVLESLLNEVSGLKNCNFIKK